MLLYSKTMHILEKLIKITFIIGPDYVTAEVKSTSSDRANMGRTTQSVSVLGGVANLFCNTTAPSSKNPPILVIWYKNGGDDPVYR